MNLEGKAVVWLALMNAESYYKVGDSDLERYCYFTNTDGRSVCFSSIEKDLRDFASTKCEETIVAAVRFCLCCGKPSPGYLSKWGGFFFFEAFRDTFVGDCGQDAISVIERHSPEGLSKGKEFWHDYRTLAWIIATIVFPWHQHIVDKWAIRTALNLLESMPHQEEPDF